MSEGGIIAPVEKNFLTIQNPSDGFNKSFVARLHEEGIRLSRTSLDTLQVNLGKLCNQACHHCHVDAGPTRTEIMAWSSMERILAFVERSDSDPRPDGRSA